MGDETKTPGGAVREAMEALGWTQPDLAYVLGTTTASVNQILNDKRAISHNMAKALSVALKISPEELARLQAEWDLRRADDPDPSIATRARIFERYPLREMAKRGWIDPEHRTKSIEAQICEFFGVHSLNEVPYLAHSAKRTSYDHIPATQLAWLFRVRQIAKETTCPQFSRERLQQAIEQ
jgi:HTH-type transcriptional regulator/antitoxin HigA